MIPKFGVISLDYLISNRVHSIFVLRLFNDGVAMWLLYAAVYLFLLNR